MKASEVRQSFLDFFQERGHKIVPSAPVAPLDDPTLLFTNAGMNQFKDVFLGTGTRPYNRAADSQKCIRVSGKHNDLEEVGNDTYHHTFFEMLGNWSFGDYYKKEAIAWAWELVTGMWGIPKDKLWATVFREDDEAESLWKSVTDIGHSHVLRFNEKDNFWEMGETGPCGPCSEIHIDRGEGYCDKTHVPGHVCGVNVGCARFIELWNLVFIQYNRIEGGTLKPLESKHVDTGMGLERVASVMAGQPSNYDTDLFIPIFESIAKITGKSWKEDKTLPPFRVIADHIRTLTFAVTDGVIPSNDGRGYVLRRLLRRASRYGRKLDMKEPFIYKLVPTVVEVMGNAYPEISERIQHTTAVIKSEEERFNEVLDRGMELFEETVTGLRGKKSTVIPGSDAFKLYDTYGFPLDLTQLLAREQGVDVDAAGFEKEMEAQRKRGRDAHSFTASSDEGGWTVISEGTDSGVPDKSEFIGYDAMEFPALVRRFKSDGERFSVILDRTPFYAESGGQVGDQGWLEGLGFRFRVEDTKKQGDRILHLGVFETGSAFTGSDVMARVDRERRLSTARNHTATHLLHKALREVLGEHAHQSGSLVEPDRFRFDFTHFEGMNADQLNDVERRVNRKIRENLTVSKSVSSLDEAKAAGATALFSEKYGETVRVIHIADYSMELCGGTHLDATGEIGFFRILKEEGIAAGVRRIEAVTGEAAETRIKSEQRILRELGGMLKASESELPIKVQALFDEKKDLERRLKKAASSGFDPNAILSKAIDVNGVKVLAVKVEAENVEEIKTIGDRLKEALKSGVIVLGAAIDDKATLLCVVTEDLVKSKSLKAGDIVKSVAQIVQGSGGGKPTFALAGGKDPSKLDEAMKAVAGIVVGMVK